ncbi:TPA: transposase [Escherichia coli]|nr:transposase [Escherichia coli]HBB3360068.1 transposase [Escherichia coli]
MPHVAARTASRDRDTGRYQSHRPEQTLLYQIVDEYYPAFAALMAEQGKELPGYVQREFEEFLQCGRLEHGFLRVRCESCHAEHLVAFSCKRRGFCPSCGARRMAESAALLDELPKAKWLLADRGYDADWYRDALQAKGITPCIPGRKSRKKTIKYDKRRYKRRNRIEIMFGRLKDWRRVATRYDRCPMAFLSAIALAATVIFWL